MLMPYVAVAETPMFIRQAEKIWGNEEREAFIDFIARNPEGGDIIPETGGARKIRWTRAGTGKRGGTRVIYFFCDRRTPIYLLMVYAKARQENLSADEKRDLRQLASVIKAGTQR